MLPLVHSQQASGGQLDLRCPLDAYASLSPGVPSVMVTSAALARSMPASCSCSSAATSRSRGGGGGGGGARGWAPQRRRVGAVDGGDACSSIRNLGRGAGCRPRGRGGAEAVTRAAAGGKRLDGGLVIRDVGYTPTSSGDEILKCVNLRLPPKGLNLIVGRSGSGKSTLLSIVAGLAGGVLRTSIRTRPTLHLLLLLLLLLHTSVCAVTLHPEGKLRSISVRVLVLKCGSSGSVPAIPCGSGVVARLGKVIVG